MSWCSPSQHHEMSCSTIQYQSILYILYIYTDIILDIIHCREIIAIAKNIESKTHVLYTVIVSIISIVFPEEKHNGLEVAEAPVPKLRLRAAGCLRSDATHRSHSHDWMNLDDLWEESK